MRQWAHFSVVEMEETAKQIADVLFIGSILSHQVNENKMPGDQKAAIP